jgi:quinol monooxygenase YgiN
MYGLISKLRAVEGRRKELAEILLTGTRNMPGCLSYVVAEDPEDDMLWIAEVWEDAEAHQASLQLASVKQAISEGRPLIADFEQRVETRPLGGQGLD